MRRNAFTLVEVLAAAVIAGVILAALMGSLFAAFRARRSAMDSVAGRRAGRVATNVIGRDLRSTLSPTGVLAGSFVASHTVNARGDATDSVSFYNIADPRNVEEGRGDVERVTLEVIPASQVGADGSTANGTTTRSETFDDPNELVLVRRVTRQLLAPVAQTPMDEVICRHVRSFSLLCYDGTQWMDNWDAAQQGHTLPLAVRVTLQLDRMPTSDGGTAAADAAEQAAATATPYTVSRVVALSASTMTPVGGFTGDTAAGEAMP